MSKEQPLPQDHNTIIKASSTQPQVVHTKTRRQNKLNMNPIGFSLLSLASLALVSIVIAQERAPHGLVYENPEAFSPSAYNFFHPNERKPETKDPCAASKCSPMPLAAQVEATEIHESKASTPQGSKKQLGAGSVAGIIFGVAFVVLLALGVYHVRVTRRANMSKAKANGAVQPDAIA
ncbi:hypothetical protein JHK82_034184 [Glycine max]|uniref:Transmembrane protein n=2 Tax=Glycine subgen. Soja TaxID=1462606 RepID=I1LTI2_SOYBN|nr:uncharacterized protein LOC100818411 [Glycine max]XP_028192486.1 uncharacterized protein LOC114378139 [Glycine soja]KAG4986560.1 hypothetical protein JHK86_034251 [Glycine max]KAG5119764.1 hypothetical protein JHK82_034184 [Glycine max]KAG5140755.1 hypothetical protein JHK84_034523 [Glycine max]KAH1143605.1 hypothetical protein GYH30_034048 [Glycine max]KAH1222133.1 hypothetical protein GmHk_12G035374 [Glycine max]|eukprot:XP_003540177.1 uncharacterized protein LOC100818411 [Glycine max]